MYKLWLCKNQGKRARLEGTNGPSAALLTEAIFNYVLTVEEYVFALSEGKMPKNCERDRKIVKEPGKMWKSPEKCAKLCKWFLFSFMRSNISFSFKPCRERTCVTEQKILFLARAHFSSCSACAIESAVIWLLGTITTRSATMPLIRNFFYTQRHVCCDVWFVCWKAFCKKLLRASIRLRIPYDWQLGKSWNIH